MKKETRGRKPLKKKDIKKVASIRLKLADRHLIEERYGSLQAWLDLVLSEELK